MVLLGRSLEDWEVFVRNLIDKGVHVFISGSSSKLLSKEVATQLRGRKLSNISLKLQRIFKI